MDLGIAGRWALVCGASKGLGLGCAQALVAEGAHVVIAARHAPALEQAAARLRALPGAGQVRAVVADVATEAGREAALAACPQVDILVNNAGGPPPGDFRDWTRQDWLAAIDANMLAPIALIRATVDAMCARGFGRIVNITSNSVKAPIDILGLSNGARSGLTGFVAGLARNPRIAGSGVTINNLLPGRFLTDRLRQTFRVRAEAGGGDEAAIAAAQQAEVPAGRFGTAEEFGAACAFLCSAHAGYVTGQNLLIDGGAYPGTF
jgi:3-oxoacyl-[acyl-carrier protein] reductase